VRQLFPFPVDSVDPLSVYGPLPASEGRPSVRLNMIASTDGATAVSGVSGSLGEPGRKRARIVFGGEVIADTTDALYVWPAAVAK
jgi:hypothetical protein